MTASTLALTIAGSDPSGGAGLQADLSVFSKHGLRAGAVVTALTVQSGRGVRRSVAVDSDLVGDQLEALMEDHRVGVAKVGMLGARGTAERVADIWEHRGEGAPLVVDTVLVSSSGTPLLEPEGLRVLRERLLPQATLITPNLVEAAALLGSSGIVPDEVVDAAASLLRLGPRAVVITGGHGPSDRAVVDTAVTAEGNVFRVEGPRVDSPHSHGTGCLFSAAVAAALALGAGLEDAVRHGRACVVRGLEHGREGAVWLDALPAGFGEPATG